jgi:hypothetical protein
MVGLMCIINCMHGISTIVINYHLFHTGAELIYSILIMNWIFYCDSQYFRKKKRSDVFLKLKLHNPWWCTVYLVSTVKLASRVSEYITICTEKLPNLCISKNSTKRESQYYTVIAYKLMQF